MTGPFNYGMNISSNNAGVEVSIAAGQKIGWIGTQTTNDFAILTGDTNESASVKLTVAQGGNVGIGTGNSIRSLNNSKIPISSQFPIKFQ